VPVDDLSELNGNESLDSFTDIANGETEITLTSDDEERYFSLSASPVGDSQRGRVFIFRETTKEREYRLRIEAQRDNLETLNGVLRHDIRNDLQVVTGYADLLGEKSETRDEQQYIHTIKKSADHAIELTQTARELSDAMLSANVEQGRVDLQSVLEDEVKEVQSSYPDATLKFGTSIPTVTLIANEMISSVFRNLLKNAIQHNDKDTAEVTISITEYDDTVTVNIADNGPGVPDGQKETVFGKGEQGLDSSGTGMGLYLVDTLVSAHNGEVWIDDNEPEGAIFSVELPTQL
jgi:signal transduction histidine kinase